MDKRRWRQRDFFIADLSEVAAKDDLLTMEHPFFALKAADYRVRVYEHNGVTVTIKPGADGCATIFDKDLWIYLISQLVEGLNRERQDVGRVVYFTAYDFFLSTRRGTDGDGYKRMKEALARLKGTVIETNIKTAGRCERAGFGLIDSWRIIRKDGSDRMESVEVTLPDWLWRAVRERKVLTLNPDYFSLRKPFERRLYELARKHCGMQPKWRCGLSILQKKSGRAGSKSKFRDAVKKVKRLPDYHLSFDEKTDTVTFWRRQRCG